MKGRHSSSLETVGELGYPARGDEFIDELFRCRFFQTGALLSVDGAGAGDAAAADAAPDGDSCDSSASSHAAMRVALS